MAASGIVERLTGVGAIVIVPNQLDRGFPTLQELQTKRSTNKLAGQRSHPMETREPRESYDRTFRRLGKEEVQFANFNLGRAKRSFLGWVEITPGVILYNSLFEAPSEISAIIGSESREVRKLRWDSLEQILDSPRYDLPSLRPGCYESVEDSWIFIKDPDNFSPRMHRYYQLRDKNPSGMFDLVEEGFSVSAAASRLGLSLPAELDLAA